MFVDYYYYLKERLPVSITEYLTLMEALDKGLVHNIVEFYYVSRSILCKHENQFDVYDIAFANFFKNAALKFPDEIKKAIWDWLDKSVPPPQLLEQFREFLDQNYDIEELRKQFEELLKKQNEEHNLGDHWIGTQGESRFGHGGFNPMGMRVGGGTGMRSAILIAEKRIFQDYRKDIVLDTRQVKVALKRLRKLEEIGKRDILNMDKTVDKTAKNGGDIELFFDKKTKNNVRLILLMDVGGSMTPYARLVNLIFSAANNMSHWKEFKHYYFHNCIYEQLYNNAQRNPDEAIDFEEFLKKYDSSSYKIVIVGDAAMASWELTERYGSIYYYQRNEFPGIYYVREMANHFKNNVVWLNPELIREQWQPWTRKIISSVIPMYDLTLEGLEDAMNYLRKSGKNIYTSVHRLKGFTY